jgi:hypothetical protein
MFKKILSPVAVLLLGCIVSEAGAESPVADKTVDARVEAALKGAGLAYSIDGGDFRLKYDVAQGRTQLVWVASHTAMLAKLELRDVWSVAYRGQGALPADLATRLLKENVRMVLGAWQVNEADGEYLVVFSAPVAAGADAATLAEVIEVVMLSADRMEKELTGKDDF